MERKIKLSRVLVALLLVFSVVTSANFLFTNVLKGQIFLGVSISLVGFYCAYGCYRSFVEK